MTLSISTTHAFVSAKADSGDASLVNASNWNAAHSVSMTLANSRVVGRNTAGAGAAEEVTASQLLDWVTNTNGVLLTRTAGSWAAVANVATDNGDLVLANNASAVAPGSGSKVFSQSLGGRAMPAFVASVGDKSFVQPLWARKHIVSWKPKSGGSSFDIHGSSNSTNLGTLTARAPGTTSAYTAAAKMGMVSAGTGTGVAGTRNGSALMYWSGNAAGLGGYFVVWRFAISDAALVSTGRTFVGLWSAAAPTDVDPSTLTNILGIGNDNGDANLQLYASGGVAQARTSLGSSFPANTTKVDLYELTLFCAPNASQVTYQVVRLNTGDTVSGTISAAANLPSNSTRLANQMWRSEGGTATAVGIDILSFYSETDY